MILKLLMLVGVVWMWVAAGDWVNNDSQIHGLGYQKWSLIHYLPFVLVAFILFFLPIPLWIKRSVMFAVFFFTWLPYVLVHNKNVEPHETVLTASWWRFAMATVLGSIGIKMSTERKADYEKGAAGRTDGHGGRRYHANNANLLTARQSPGYLLVKDLFAEMVKRRADKVMLDYAAAGRDRAVRNRRRLASWRGPRSRVERRDAGRDEDAGEPERERSTQEAGR